MLFRKKIKKRMAISITDPCSESWNGMKVVDDVQRHCESCVKNVIDFTRMSDDEVVSFFSKTNEKICGRFRPGQLNRVYTPLPETTRAANWWKAALLLPLTFFAKNTSAQQNDSIPHNDTLIASKDSIPKPIEIPPDSSLVEVDSLSANNDSVVDPIAIKAEETPQEIIWATVLAGGTTVTLGWSVPEFILTGDVTIESPPLLEAVGIVNLNCVPGPPPPPQLDFIEHIRSYDYAYNEQDDALQQTTPNDIVVEDTKGKPDPIPPTIPETPWYEAILPPSLRPRRNG